MTLDELEDVCDQRQGAGLDLVQLVVPGGGKGHRVRLFGTWGPYSEEIACETERGVVAWWPIAKIRAVVAAARAESGGQANMGVDPLTPDRGRCRGCDAPVLWLRTPTGGKMICDPELVPFWAGTGSERIVAQDGRVLAGSRRQTDLFAGPPIQGYVPHWATCPEADQFRKTP